jgi:hypothetical protein
MSHWPRLRRRAALALVASALVVLPWRLAGADAHLHGGTEENYWFTIPETWAWGRAPDFAKYGAVEVAERRIPTLPSGDPTKLANGTVVTGSGGRTVLTRQPIPKELDEAYEQWLGEMQVLDQKAREIADQGSDVPEELANQIKAARKKCDDALEGFAKHEKVQDLLLSRFGKSPPPVQVDMGREVSYVPAAELKVEGTAPNLAGEDAPCEGQMLVWVVRKELWRMCTWLWPAPRLVIPLRTDRDMIELQFVMPKTSATPKRPVEVQPAGVAGSPDPAKEGDAEQEKKIQDLSREAELFKPKGWVSKAGQAIDRSKPFERDLCFQISRHDRAGSEAIVSVLAIHMVGGTTPFDPDGHMERLWRDFQGQHLKGPIQTFPFPRITDKAKFFTLPDFTKPKEVDRTVDKDGKPELVKRSRLEDMGVVEEAKGVPMLDKEKIRMTWRISLRGNLDRVGEETLVQYVFATNTWAYVVYVTFRKDGQKAWEGEVAKVLASFHLIEAPKGPK